MVMERLKKIYALRLRDNTELAWNEPAWYRSKKTRDKTASINRTIGGIQTHSYDIRKPLSEIEAMEFED